MNHLGLEACCLPPLRHAPTASGELTCPPVRRADTLIASDQADLEQLFGHHPDLGPAIVMAIAQLLTWPVFQGPDRLERAD